MLNKRKQRAHKYIYRECSYCKKLYKVYPSGLERSRYCSRICKDSNMIGKILNKTNKKGRPIGSVNSTTKKIIKNCPICFKDFSIYKAQKRIYCSMACFNMDRKKRPCRRVLTLETRLKMGLSSKGRIPWNKNKVGLQKHTEEFKNKQRVNRLNYMATHTGHFRDTPIEIIMKKALIDNGLSFKQSAKVDKYCADFIVGDKVIECDGYYWHNRPGDKIRDFVRDCAIVNKGYTVLRFSDYNIENNINDCINTIKTIK